MNIAIIGCGWLGIPLGVHLLELGHFVKGSTTKTEKLGELRKLGIQPHLLEVTTELKGHYEGLFDSDVIIINIPPGRRNPNVVQQHPLQIRLLAEAAKAHKVKHLIFISSTGVYKNTNAVIDEDGPCIPTRSSSQALLRAESIIRASGIKWTIVRLAGLVGANRKPGQWFAGKTDIPNGDSPVNMIHLDDCVHAISLLLNYPPGNEVYNLCADGHPVKKEFYAVQSSKIKEELPQFNDGTGTFKIIDNSKFKKKFRFTYSHPDPNQF